MDSPAGNGRRAGRRYAAFISYNRAADQRLAPALRLALQRFAKPWYRLRALRVFQDDSSLSANPGLWSSVVEALDASDNLVLLASPGAAASDWVGREIEHWRAHREAGRLLIILTEGRIAWDAEAGDFDFEASDALPPALSRAFSEEPRYVDLSWVREREHLSSRDPRFRDAVADVAATLHGRPKDELVGEDVRQHRRTRMLAASGAVVLTCLAVAATVAAVLAVRSRDQAQSRQLAAEADAALAIDPQRSVELAAAARATWATAEAQRALDEARIASHELRRLEGHVGPVNSVEYAPDGRTLLTAGADGMARLWSTRTGRAAVIDACPAACLSAHFSPGGGWIATAGDDGTIGIFDARTGKALGTPVMHPGLAALAFLTPRLLVSAGADGRVRLWRAPGLEPVPGRIADVGSGVADLATSPAGRLMAVARADGRVSVWNAARDRPPVTIGRAGGRATSVTFTRSGRRVVAGSQDRTALVWDLARPGTVPLVLRGQEGLVATVAAGADERVATAGSGGTARIWDARSGRLLFTLQGHTGLVVRARFSPDGARLATAANDGTARVWDARTGGLRAVLAGHRSNVRDVAFAPDAATVATGAFDGTARLWDVTRGGSAADLVDHRGSVTAVAFLGSSGGVVTAAHDGTIDVWRRGHGQPVRRIRAARTPIQAAAVDATSRYVAAGDHRGRAALWEVRTGRGLLSLPTTSGIVYDVGFDRAGLRLAAVGEGGVTLATRGAGGWSEASVRRLSGPEAGGLSLAFDRAGAKLAIAGVDGRIRVWSTGAEAHPRVWRDQGGVLFDVEFSPDGALLASGGRDGIVRLRDARMGALRRALRGHEAPVGAVRFSPTGDRLVSASQDGTAVIWRVADGRRLAVLSAHSAPVLDAAFTPSGEEVVTASEDGTARLWDGHDGRRLARFLGARAAAISLAVSCDGRQLATGSSDAVARVYDLTYKGRVSLLTPSGGPPGDARHEQPGC